MDYQEKSSSITVPRNTGIDGFLRTLRGILLLPRVQSISIDSKGVVNYTRYVRDGEDASPVKVDYTGLEPWSIIRNGDIQEMDVPPGTPAPMVIAYMFDLITREGLVPIAFVTGAGSDFWRWHQQFGVQLTRAGSAYGLAIHTDRQMPDHSLVLCAGYIRGGLLDCHRFIMTGMNAPLALDSPPPTTVQII